MYYAIGIFRVFFNFLRRSLILNYTMKVKTEKLNDNKNKSSKLAGSTEKYPQRCIAAFNCIKEKLKKYEKSHKVWDNPQFDE